MRAGVWSPHSQEVPGRQHLLTSGWRGSRAAAPAPHKCSGRYNAGIDTQIHRGRNASTHAHEADSKITETPRSPFPSPSVPSPSSSALCLTPVSGLGLGVSSLDTQGGHWPTGRRLRLQLCLQFPLPLPSLLLSEAPAKKASPSPKPQRRKGGPEAGAKSLSRRRPRRHTRITQHTGHTSPSPGGKGCVRTGRFSPSDVAQPQAPVQKSTGPRRSSRLGSARLACSRL